MHTQDLTKLTIAQLVVLVEEARQASLICVSNMARGYYRRKALMLADMVRQARQAEVR